MLAGKRGFGRHHQGSRAVQGRQGRGTVGTAEHEGRTHRRPATSGAVPVELKVAEITAVHPAVALVGLALLLQHHTPPFCPRVLEPDLQHPFRQASFLGKLLEILRVGIVIDREVALHRPQLVMLKARSHPLRPAVGTGDAGGAGASAEGHVYVVRVQIKTRGHSLEILGLPLPGSTLLPGRRDHGGGAIEVGHLRRRGRVDGAGGRGGLQRHRADVTVRVLGVHRVMWVRWRVVMMMMVVEELGRGEGLAGVVRPGRVDRDRRALGRMQLGAHLVVQPAEHVAVPHAEVVALRQEHRAHRAREAAHVEDELARAHHQLGRQDRRLAARAPLHVAEHPIVVLLAVDIPVSAEAGDLPVETLATVRTLEARGMPPLVDSLEVEPVRYLEAASRANHVPRNVLGLRGRRGRRFQLRDGVQVLRRGFLGVRLQMGMMMVMMVVMVMVVRSLRRHA